MTMTEHDPTKGDTMTTALDAFTCLHVDEHTICTIPEQEREPDDRLLAHVFGQMIRRCKHVLERYESDLYYDSLWLREQYPTGSTYFSFVWGYNDSHTHIGVDDPDVAKMLAKHNKHLYRIVLLRLALRPGTAEWRVRVETLKNGKAD